MIASVHRLLPPIDDVEFLNQIVQTTKVTLCVLCIIVISMKTIVKAIFMNKLLTFQILLCCGFKVITVYSSVTKVVYDCAYMRVFVCVCGAYKTLLPCSALKRHGR